MSQSKIASTNNISAIEAPAHAVRISTASASSFSRWSSQRATTMSSSGSAIPRETQSSTPSSSFSDNAGVSNTNNNGNDHDNCSSHGGSRTSGQSNINGGETGNPLSSLTDVAPTDDLFNISASSARASETGSNAGCTRPGAANDSKQNYSSISELTPSEQLHEDGGGRPRSSDRSRENSPKTNDLSGSSNTSFSHRRMQQQQNTNSGNNNNSSLLLGLSSSLTSSSSGGSNLSGSLNTSTNNNNYENTLPPPTSNQTDPPSPKQTTSLTSRSILNRESAYYMSYPRFDNVNNIARNQIPTSTAFGTVEYEKVTTSNASRRREREAIVEELNFESDHPSETDDTNSKTTSSSDREHLKNDIRTPNVLRFDPSPSSCTSSTSLRRLNNNNPTSWSNRIFTTGPPRPQNSASSSLYFANCGSGGEHTGGASKHVSALSYPNNSTVIPIGGGGDENSNNINNNKNCNKNDVICFERQILEFFAREGHILIPRDDAIVLIATHLQARQVLLEKESHYHHPIFQLPPLHFNRAGGTVYNSRSTAPVSCDEGRTNDGAPRPPPYMFTNASVRTMYDEHRSECRDVDCTHCRRGLVLVPPLSDEEANFVIMERARRYQRKQQQESSTRINN